MEQGEMVISAYHIKDRISLARHLCKLYPNRVFWHYLSEMQDYDCFEPIDDEDNPPESVEYKIVLYSYYSRRSENDGSPITRSISLRSM